MFTRDNLGRIATNSETIGGKTTSYGYNYDASGRLSSVLQNGVIAIGRERPASPLIPPEKRYANRSTKERLDGFYFASRSNSKNSTMSSGGSILALANSSLSCSMSVLSFSVTASRWPSDNS